jgi:hypothetical protein
MPPEADALAVAGLANSGILGLAHNITACPQSTTPEHDHDHTEDASTEATENL